ncbi:MAG: uroporphyrinogen-III synthase [Flavobacteriaceae bacterium]|nr:uroporphyrinogen-III synthase [Flavobacteriaceae bacterium]
MRLLATKTLSNNLRERLIQRGISLIEYPLIRINPIPLYNLNFQDSLIFTSQNAVNLAFDSSEIRVNIQGKKYFCVGEKTKKLLEEKGQKVLKMTKNAFDLAHFLVKNHKNDSFSFFCGKLRRVEIEYLLTQEKINLQIHELYNTIYTSKHFQSKFGGILFFSPSAVNSFFSKNTWPAQTHGFCIGSSTSEVLKQYTTNYSQAKKPSENHLLFTINHYYTKHYVEK